MKTTVTLSKLFLIKLWRITFSIARPVNSWTFFTFLCYDSVPHAVLITSFVDILSNIPSPFRLIITIHPNKRKSYSSLILNENTSGSAETTLGIPLYFGSFASESPIVLDTANLPGSTLNGPVMYSILFSAV